jgi:DNA-binding NarL/FixJ family response regulator
VRGAGLVGATRAWGDTGTAWRVLIVDDHAAFRAGARALLEVGGFDVVGEAADGESAIEHARRPILSRTDASGQSTLLVMNADGSGVQHLTRAAADPRPRSWG